MVATFVRKIKQCALCDLGVCLREVDFFFLFMKKMLCVTSVY